MVTIIGIPFDGKSSYLPGAALAPERIREEFRSPAYNVFSESLINVQQGIEDHGDIRAETYDELHQQIHRLDLGRQPYLFLGGDHSITYVLIKKLCALYGRTFHILQFDAHGDLYDEFEGDRFSHACSFARIMEEGLALSLTQVGIRALTPHQREQAERFGVTVFHMDDVERFNPSLLRGPLYISLDMDAFDPAFAPGVSHHEAGGLNSRQVIQWLHQIRTPVIGADLVEFNPSRDNSGITAALCAKLMKEFIQLMLQ